MKRRHEEHDGDHGGGGSGGAHALGERVRVRSAEGEEVAWSRSAAARSAALAKKPQFVAPCTLGNAGDNLR